MEHPRPQPQEILSLDLKRLDEQPIETVLGMARGVEAQLSEMVAALATEQEQLEAMDVTALDDTALEELNTRISTMSEEFDTVTAALEKLHGYLTKRLAHLTPQ